MPLWVTVLGLELLLLPSLVPSGPATLQAQCQWTLAVTNERLFLPGRGGPSPSWPAGWLPARLRARRSQSFSGRRAAKPAPLLSGARALCVCALSAQKDSPSLAFRGKLSSFAAPASQCLLQHSPCPPSSALCPPGASRCPAEWPVDVCTALSPKPRPCRGRSRIQTLHAQSRCLCVPVRPPLGVLCAVWLARMGTESGFLPPLWELCQSRA